MIPHILYVFFMSMLPLVELRGGVILGTALGLPWYINLPVCVIGNMVPIPFILMFIPKILDWLEKFKPFKPIVGWLRRRAEKNSEKIVTTSFIGLFLFVALPIPGTGAWTGSLVSSLFSLPRWRSFFTVLLGVIACGVIMTLACYGFVGFLDFLK